MIFYNKAMMTAAGIDPANPPLATYDQFLATSKKLVSSGAAPYAIYPAPSSEFFQSWFDFYPLFAAATGGKQLVKDGKSQFAGPEGVAVANFWKQMYADKLAGNETYTGDSFADGKAAMAIVGPWAIAAYQGKVDWGVVPVPTADGTAADRDPHLLRRQERRHVRIVHQPGHRLGLPEVQHLGGSGRPVADPDRADADAHGPADDLRRLLRREPDSTSSSPSWPRAPLRCRTFPTRCEIWQTFRDAWTNAVIFGKTDVQQALTDAATKIDALAGQS